MAQLIVRNLDESLVTALKRRAAQREHSTEQEHREILHQALRAPRRKTLAQVLTEIPAVGTDEDFARAQSDHRR
jgi:plasmid stability protein